MDVPLYGIALAIFAVLYLAMGVFLAYTLLITLVIMFMYLAIRHGSLPDNYPHGLGDTLITVIFIGVTWGIFTWLGPKNSIPFVGSGFTYTSPNAVPVTAILEIALVIAFAFLFIGAFIANQLRDQPIGGGSGGEKPKQGVGA